jgi:hypothetical protein
MALAPRANTSVHEQVAEKEVRVERGWVRRWYRYHPLPEELGVRLAPHPAQAARRKFQVSDGTP